jgi:hypothetical protein
MHVVVAGSTLYVTAAFHLIILHRVCMLGTTVPPMVLLLLLQGKPFAVFGCGDAVRFKNNYADAIGEVSVVFTAT